MSDLEVKQQVRKFYDQVGWQIVSDGFYQNARYEDLRSVSQDYIGKCHMRINRHLIRPGKYLLDAGSGPIQYPAYLTYSEGYQYRICADISIVALKEARKRIGQKGLFVVADVAQLPFCENAIDGVVSLHTLHHLPLSEQKKAYKDIYRVLANGKSAVLVNGWTESSLMNKWQWFVRLMETIGGWVAQIRRKKPSEEKLVNTTQKSEKQKKPTGTFVEKLDAAWIRRELEGKDLQILVWRSVSVRFLRAVIHELLAGKLWLKLLYNLEEKYPEYYGEHGQYPLIVFRKSGA
ncbi:MAG: class I SAM-dependent methyltransferase [Anaerolineaceae bacterium]|nr:class I SAM-dependent methyltransferase [Anaerolineaceae bacterium]